MASAWVGGGYPNRGPVERALRWDGSCGGAQRWEDESQQRAYMPSIFVDLLPLSIASAIGPGQIIFDALGIGAALVATSPNLWVLTLNALAVIDEAQLNRSDSIIAFLLFVLLAVLLLLLPILSRIILPGQATNFLNAVSAWLIRHNRVLMIVISLVFGLYFLVKGISRLLA